MAQDLQVSGRTRASAADRKRDAQKTAEDARKRRDHQTELYEKLLKSMRHKYDEDYVGEEEEQEQEEQEVNAYQSRADFPRDAKPNQVWPLYGTALWSRFVSLFL